MLCVLVVTGVSAVAASAPTYREEVMADSPAGYWRLSELTGTVAADATSNNSPGTYKNGVVLGVPGALTTDPTNTAARFDGGNDLVEVADPASGILDVGTDDFTVEAWVKTSVNDERGIAGKGVGAGSWQVTVTDDSGKTGRVRAYVNDGVTPRTVYSTVRVDDGAWHHVVVRFNRDANISFYTDAKATGSGGGAHTGALGSATPLQIGKVPDRPYFKGDIDDVAVYRSLLSPSRIGAHYNASAPDDTAPQVTLDEPADGTNVSDTTPSLAGTAGSAVGDPETVTLKLHPGSDTSAPAIRTITATRDGDDSYAAETTPAITPGTYTAVATQTDRVGNTGTSSTRTFTVPPGSTDVGPSPTIVAAGDIAACGGTTSGEGQTAAQIESLPSATVLTLGDNAYPNGTAAEFANCYDPVWGRFKDRTKPAAGGHDYNTPGAAGYYGYFGAAAGDPSEGYYSYDLGSWHVVTLNANCPQVSCDAGDAQEQWLRADLAANSSSCTLAVLHEPRFSSGAVHGGTTDGIDLWHALYEDGAEVVLSGDDHLYERFLPQTPDGDLDYAHGITQFVVGTGGFYIYDFAATEVNSDYQQNTSYGVLKATLHPDRFAYKYLRTDGNPSTDSGSIDCHGAGDYPPPDTSVPNTTIESGPSGTVTSTSATFDFSTDERGAVFRCSLDGAGYLPCNDPKTFTALADGSHSLSVRAVDAAGNTDATPASRSWTVDTTPPETTIDSGPSGTVDQASASFGFSSSESNSTFECKLDTGAWESCPSPQSYSALAAGVHTFEVRAIDPVGHTDLSPESRTWTIDLTDTTAPDTAIDSGPSGSIPVDSASFAFSADEAGSTFECKLDGAWESCTSPQDYLGLVNGSHTFEVRASDAAGNVDGSPATRAFTVDAPPAPDTTPPNTSILLGPSGTTTGTSTSFSFSASEIGSTFECKLDSDAWEDCSSAHAYSNLLDGPHTFEVRATDPADNIDQSPATSSWTVDAVGPQTSITAGPSSLTQSKSASLSFTSSESGSSFECRIDSDPWTACSSPTAYANLADGSHTFEVVATDAYGNADTTAASRTWTVDTTAPDTNLLSGPSGVVTTPSVTFTFSGSEGGTTYQCRVDGGVWGTCTTPHFVPDLPDGPHTFDVRALDTAGNADTTPATRSWVTNALVPNTTITSGPSGPTNATTASFGFTASEPGSSFQCRINTGAWGTCTSPKTYAGLPPGNYSFDVRTIDAGGSVDPTPAGRTWTIDTTAPQTTLISAPSGVVASRNASLTFSSSETGSSFQCRIDGGAWTACSSPKYYSDLTDGVHTAEVRAIDAAGNADATPASRTWTVDATAPDTTITLGTSGSVKSASAIFWFASNESGSTFQCRLDAGAWAVCSSPKFYLDSISIGTHRFYVRAVDAAGNLDPSPATRTWERRK
jgi:hypothetical protein